MDAQSIKACRNFSSWHSEYNTMFYFPDIMVSNTFARIANNEIFVHRECRDDG